MDGIERDHHDKKDRQSDQMMDEVRNGYRNRQDLRGNDRFRDQRGVVGYGSAIPYDRVAEQHPGKESTQDKNREIIGAGFLADSHPEDHAHHKRVADKEHDRMDKGPEESADGPDIAVFEIPKDQVLQKVAMGTEFSDQSEHPYPYTGHFSPLKGPLLASPTQKRYFATHRRS